MVVVPSFSAEIAAKLNGRVAVRYHGIFADYEFTPLSSGYLQWIDVVLTL